jgi:hypothetical protein
MRISGCFAESLTGIAETTLSNSTALLRFIQLNEIAKCFIYSCVTVKQQQHRLKTAAYAHLLCRVRVNVYYPCFSASCLESESEQGLVLAFLEVDQHSNAAATLSFEMSILEVVAIAESVGMPLRYLYKFLLNKPPREQCCQQHTTKIFQTWN